MPLPAWLLAMLPGLVGGATGAVIQQGQVNRMNRYNDPRAQLQRLNAAGLPFAAFSQGQAGNQSSLPDMSEIGKGISGYMENRIMQEQTKLLKEQVRQGKAQADILEMNRDILRDENSAMLDGGQVIDGQARSRAYISKLQDFEMKKLTGFMTQYDKEMKEIDKLIKSDLYESGKLKDKAHAEIDGLLLRNDLAKQLYEDNRMRTLARNRIIGMMERNGLSFTEALIIQLMSSLSGGLSAGGASLGF